MWPYGLQPARLLHPRDSPGKNTGVGCHFLLQGIFLTQGLSPGLLAGRFFTVRATKVMIISHLSSAQNPTLSPYFTQSENNLSLWPSRNSSSPILPFIWYIHPCKHSNCVFNMLPSLRLCSNCTYCLELLLLSLGANPIFSFKCFLGSPLKNAYPTDTVICTPCPTMILSFPLHLCLLFLFSVASITF